MPKLKYYIETERLILRDMSMSDLEGMFELDSNPKVHQYLGNKPVKTIKESEEMIHSITAQYNERGIGRFSVVLKSSGAFIGWSGIKFNTGDNEVIGNKRDFYDVGYRFIEQYWNQGYGYESAKAALEFGFKELNLKTIVGAAETENIASNKILEKIGLQYTETFPLDDVMIHWYELKQEDYEKRMS